MQGSRDCTALLHLEVVKFDHLAMRILPEIKNHSLFAYTLVLLTRLPDESSKKSLFQTVETVISEYRVIWIFAS